MFKLKSCGHWFKWLAAAIPLVLVATVLVASPVLATVGLTATDTLTSTVAGDTTTHTINITTANNLPANGRIQVVFPTGFNVAGATLGTITGPDGNFTLEIDAPTNTVTVVRDSGNQYPPGAISVPINGIVNTQTVGSTYKVTVTTLMSLGTIIEGPSDSPSFSITKRPITVTPNSGQTKVYGTADPTFTYGYTGTLMGSDTFTGVLSRDTGANVGTYNITQNTLSITNIGNYNLTFTTGVTFSITAKTLTVGGTFTANNKPYDGGVTATILGNSLTLVGVEAGDTGNVTLNAVVAFASAAAANSKTVSLTGASSLSGSANGNYTLSLSGAPTTTANITPKPVTVTPDPGQSKVYNNSSDPTFTYTNTPLVGADAISGSLGRAAGQTVTGGPYTYTLGSLTAGSNYSLSLGGANTFAITAKPITITPTDGQSKVYGASDPVFAYTPTPALVGGDSFTGALGRVAGETVASSPYAYNMGDLSAGTNYTLSLASGHTFAITAKPLTVGGSFTANNKTYDGGVTATIKGSSLTLLPTGYHITAIATGAVSIQWLAVAPNGTLYAVDGDGYIDKIVSGVVTARAGIGESPSGARIAVSADGNTLYVGTQNAPGNILTFNAATLAAGTPIATFGGTSVNSLAVASDGTLYAADGGGYINKIVGGVVTAHVGIGESPFGDVIALSADGNTLYLGTRNNGNVHPFDTATLTEGSAIAAHGGTAIYSFAVYGTTLYAADGDGYINKIVGGAVTAWTAIGESPFADRIAVSPDGSTLYVGTRNDGNIHKLNTDSFTWGTPIATAASAFNAVVMAPDGTLYAGDRNSGNIYANDLFLNPVLTFASPNVANGITVSLTGSTLGGAAASNYTLSLAGAPTTTANITAKALTVTATGPTKIYGTALTAGTSTTNFTAGATGVGSETVTGVTLTPDAAGLSATTAASSPYVVTPSLATGTGGFLASNYNITYNPYNGTVTAAALSITADNQSKTYGDSGAAFFGAGKTAFTPVGLQNGETVGTVTLTDTNTGAPTNAAAGGSYAITPSLATGGTFTASNYTITYHAGTLTINTHALSITADNQSKTYGASGAAFFGAGKTAFSSIGLQNSETIGSVTLTDTNTGAPATAAAGGSYAITPSLAVDGTFTASNYTITYHAGTLTINTHALSITADNQSKTYGDSGAAFFGAGQTTFSSIGLQNSETIGSVTLTDTNTGAPATAAAGGSYAITPTLATGGTFTASNYAITYHAGTLTVNTHALSITANNQSKTYGESGAAFFGAGQTTFSSIGLQNSETIGSVTLTDTNTGAPATAAAGGSYAITPSLATGGSFTASNYTITYHAGTLTINTHALSITADNQSKTYGASGAAFFGAGKTAFSSIGLQNSETIGSVTLTDTNTGAPATAAAGGSYAITPSLAVDGTFTASNYTITYHAGTLTVNVKPITVTAVAQSKTADASMPTLTWNVSPSISGLAALTGSLDVTWGIGNSHIVGIYPIVQGTVTNGNNPNYNITYVGDNLTVTPGAATKVVVTISPAGAVAGSAFVTQPTVKIEDFYGNTVNSTATVELGIKSGTGAPGASLAGGATSMSATGGVANFSSLGINWAYSGYVLTATSTGLASGDSSSFDVTAPSGVTSYTFPLNPGWNLISLPLIPTDSSITAVLGGLSVPYATNVLSVWSYNAATTTWTSWAPGVPSPSLTTMVDGKGYWIHMIDALPAGTTITFSGSALPLGGITPPPSYAVVVGWNLMGFESTLANTVTNYLTGNNYRFPIYWYGLNTYYAISTGGSFFQPGLGYWVYFNAAGVVTPS